MHDHQRLKRLAARTVALGLVMLAAGWCRLWPPPALLQPCLDILRWREALAMLVFIPAMVLTLWLLFATLADGHLDAWAAVFVLGACALGSGIGTHETSQVLQATCSHLNTTCRQNLEFLDNRLSHWVFWSGFVLCSLALVGAQLRHPLQAPMPAAARLGFALLGLPPAVVMVTNLIWEDTRGDVAVIATALLATLALHAAHRVPLSRAPFLCVLYPPYTAAVIITLIWWLATGGPPAAP